MSNVMTTQELQLVRERLGEFERDHAYAAMLVANAGDDDPDVSSIKQVWDRFERVIGGLRGVVDRAQTES